MPLLEAMRCGTPVIAANASCLPEVSGDAAKYFAPLDSDELRNVLKEVLGKKELQQDMIQKGFDSTRKTGGFVRCNAIPGGVL